MVSRDAALVANGICLEKMLYLLKNNENSLYKLGYTRVSVEQRLYAAKGYLQDVELVCFGEGGEAMEKQWHYLFAEARVFAEWFALEDHHVEQFRAFLQIPLDQREDLTVQRPVKDEIGSKGIMRHLRGLQENECLRVIGVERSDLYKFTKRAGISTKIEVAVGGFYVTKREAGGER